MRLFLIIIFATFAWAFWPVLGGDFVIDDYVFIAQSRLLDAPWSAFWSNHFYEPLYFRPLGVVSWWLATEAFGLNYPAHTAINAALHIINVALIAAFVFTLSHRRAPALAAAALFALLPFSFAATLWPSNRFDLLATSFLLACALASTHFLRNGKPHAWALAGGFALLACLSKELAFPIATAFAFALLFTANPAPGPRRWVLFALLGAAIGSVFIWRHFTLPLPYAAASGDALQALLKGASAWVHAIPKLFQAATSNDAIASAAIVAALALGGFACVSALLFPQKKTPVTTSHVIGASGVFIAAMTVQWPLAAAFAPMLDGGSLGSVTFARFFYVPCAMFAILVGLIIARGRMQTSIAAGIVVLSITIAFATRPLATEFARWTKDEITPMTNAATAVVDRVSQTAAQPCVVVLLETQTKQPWFRMFSDVSVKARSSALDTSQRCAVLTETTPWIFISRADTPLADIGLKPIALDAQGTLKPDYVWGSVRYRYRTMVEDARALPNATFYAWNGSAFVDVTSDVQRGARTVKTHGWGF